MPINDYDGTTQYQIGKVYDYDGTTQYQIGKVYDFDGTANQLIYSSELVLWDGSTGVEWSNAVSTPSASHANGEGGVSDGRQYVRAWCGGSYFADATRQCAVDLTGYNTLTITWSAASLGPNYNNQMYGVGIDLNTNWIYPGSQDISTASNVGMYTQTGGTVTFDVSGLSGVHNIGCRAQSPNVAAGDVYVYISSAVLT